MLELLHNDFLYILVDMVVSYEAHNLYLPTMHIQQVEHVYAVMSNGPLSYKLGLTQWRGYP